MLLDISLGNNFFGCDSDTKSISNKRKNQQVGLHQTKNLLKRKQSTK